MRLSRKKRGSLLLMVIIMGAILLIGVSVMFGSVQMSMTADSKFNHQEAAQDAADSAIHLALAKFKEGDFEFHDYVEFKSPSNHDIGTLTFSNDGGPYSTNNIVSSSAKTGWNGQLVPPKSAHLVAVGESGGQKQVLEIIVKQDSFPWSVASNGTIQGNDMEVFSLNSLEEADGGITEDEKQRSDILSNAGGQSIVLTGQSNISGDAKAVGKVGLSGGSVVKGKTEENQDPTQITLAKRAEDYRPPAGEYQAFPPASGKTISGWYLASGDTVIGDVTFDDGMIFVDGSATVTGKISGNGALVATKNITVTGSMNTKADLAALVAGGDISITGQGTTTSSFQGLILAEGSFKAKDTTLIGSALTLDKNGSVQLERVRTVAARDLTKIDFTYAKELKEASTSNGGSSGSNGTGATEVFGILKNDNTFTSLVPNNFESLELLAEDIVAGKSSANFAVKLDNGDILTTPPAGSSYEQAFYQSNAHWSNLIKEVKNHSVVYEQIFQLDFNKFLKTKGGFRPLLQRVNPL